MAIQKFGSPVPMDFVSSVEKKKPVIGEKSDGKEITKELKEKEVTEKEKLSEEKGK